MNDEYVCSPEEARVKSILVRLGCNSDETVYVLTNLDVAIAVDEKLAEDGINPEDLECEELSRIFHAAIDGTAEIDWNSPMRYGIDKFQPMIDPDNDDEGPLTEQFENSSRLHDDDWLEAAFEERWDE